MELIYFRGLNCHISALVSIANSLGIDYRKAFCDLWSETEFIDEVGHNIFVSRRVQRNLRALGVITEPDACGADTAHYLIGMDTYDIPWHHVYRHFHGAHYFCAVREGTGYTCYDPIHNERGFVLAPSEVESVAFEFIHVRRGEDVLQCDLSAEIKAVIDSREAVKAGLLRDLNACADDKDKLIPLIKYVIAMIDNRYMFREYVNCQLKDNLFDAYLNKWETVKNGLYKAMIVKDNKNVLNEVSTILTELMDEEGRAELLSNPLKNP